jgi:hypothetical protein
MDKQLAKAVADYMAETSDLRGRLVHKIASLSKENEQLRARAIPSSAFKAVVSKLASAGLVDEPNKAHFDSTTKDDNVGMQLEKLAAYLQKSVVEKEASVQSPYKVKKNAGVSTQDSASRQLDDRISKLARRK